MKNVLQLGLFLFISILFSTASLAAGPRVLDVHSTWPKDLVFQGDAAFRVNKTLKQLSDGKIQLEIHGAGDIVPPFEVFDAVSANIVSAGWDWIGYWSNKVPVAALMGSMPFGPSPEIFMSWIYYGGGRDILQKAYDKHNIWVMPCNISPREAGGWFNKEINTVEDFKGLKMRISGLGGKILNKLGASTQLIPGGEVYLALERGRIQATEFALPLIDQALGFPKIAKYYYFPGWHQPTSVNTFIINKDIWQQYSPKEQELFELACKENVLWSLMYGPIPQTDAIAKMEAEGVEVRRFSDEVLDELRKATKAVMQDEARKDPLFKEAYDSIQSFLSKTGRWHSLQEFEQ